MGTGSGYRWPANKPDLRHIPFDRRQQLISDNPLAIVTGDTYVCAMPIEIFRAMSILEDEIDLDHPNGPTFFLPDIETWPILEIREWARQLVEKEEYAQLEVMRDNNGCLCTFRDLSLVRAGKLLGMDLYVKDMHGEYMKKVKSGIVSYEDVDAIVKLSLSDSDTILKRLGARLGKLVHRGYATKVFPWLDGYLEDHAGLKYWIDEELEKRGRRARAAAMKRCNNMAENSTESERGKTDGQNAVIATDAEIAL
ncbi:hypothetical protein N0V95_009403 [Ascochyta clinopodiicola]|nr:hypothetical protein N0V95_009403 [Ascochyta clinopodiicola]